MRKVTKQKRRKMEKKRRRERKDRKAAKAAPLAYHGNKYRKEIYVPVILAAETAIYEAYVIADGSLTDEDVHYALEDMITRIRQSTLPDLSSMADEETQRFDLHDFLIVNIQRHWQDYFDRNGAMGRDALVGVLRTILGSVETHNSRNRSSTGYLDFLGDFLKRVGVNVEQISPSEYERIQAMTST